MVKVKSLHPSQGPKLKHPKVWGCDAYAVKNVRCGKFDVKAKRYAFVGIEGDSPNYILLEPATGNIHVSNNVAFDEASFTTMESLNAGKPAIGININRDLGFAEQLEKLTLSFGSDDDDSDSDDENNKLSLSSDKDKSKKHKLLSDEESDGNCPNRQVQQPQPSPLCRSTRRTRPNTRYPSSQWAANIHMLEDELLNLDEDFMCLSSFLNCLQAMTGGDHTARYKFSDAWNHPTLQHQWRDSIRDEFNSMVENRVWEVVELPPEIPESDVIDTRWVFREKLNTDGSVARYKS